MYVSYPEWALVSLVEYYTNISYNPIPRTNIMPILANAKKALRASERRATVNRRVKAQVKTALDQAKAKPEANTLSEAFSRIDKAVKHHLMHRNKAARLKSQLSKQMAA